MGLSGQRTVCPPVRYAPRGGESACRQTIRNNFPSWSSTSTVHVPTGTFRPTRSIRPRRSLSHRLDTTGSLVGRSPLSVSIVVVGRAQRVLLRYALQSPTVGGMTRHRPSIREADDGGRASPQRWRRRPCRRFLDRTGTRAVGPPSATAAPRGVTAYGPTRPCRVVRIRRQPPRVSIVPLGRDCLHLRPR